MPQFTLIAEVNGSPLISIILSGPFVPIAVLAQSFSRSEQIPVWLGNAHFSGLFGLWFVWYVWPPQMPPRASVLYPFYVLWWIVAAGALVTFPLVMFREGSKRDCFCADPSMRTPTAYRSSWREQFTPLHFQPRPDLLPSLDHLKAAKAPLVRKLVNSALTQSLGLKTEKLPGGVSKCTGRCGKYEVKVMVDFGGMLSQLGYTVTLKKPRGPVPGVRAALLRSLVGYLRTLGLPD